MSKSLLIFRESEHHRQEKPELDNVTKAETRDRGAVRRDEPRGGREHTACEASKLELQYCQNCECDVAVHLVPQERAARTQAAAATSPARRVINTRARKGVISDAQTAFRSKPERGAR